MTIPMNTQQIANIVFWLAVEAAARIAAVMEKPHAQAYTLNAGDTARAIFIAEYEGRETRK